MLPSHLTEPLLFWNSVPPFRSNLNLELHLRGCLNWIYALKRSLGLLDRLESLSPEEHFHLAAASPEPFCQSNV
jgi:hypothetical protein